MADSLAGKTAIIYGGGGGIGGAVAKTFAREGARVYLAGRTQEKLDAVANDITSAGGSAGVAVVDAIWRPRSGRAASGSSASGPRASPRR